MSERQERFSFQQVSTIGRTLDPAYLTNRLILILMAAGLAGGLGWGLAAGESLWEAARLGMRYSLGLFLGWALARELDPDWEWAAFAAAGSTMAGMAWWGTPDLGLVLWALLAVRVVNHTTGLSASVLDSLGLIVLGAWLSSRGNWGLGAVTGLALLGDAYLPEGKRRQIALAGTAVLIGVGVFLLGGPRSLAPVFAWEPAAAAAGLAALYGPVVASNRDLESVCDQTGEDMTARRVQAGQLLGLIIMIEIALWSGWSGAAAVLPLWGAVGGSLLYRAGAAVFENSGRAQAG